MSKSGVVFNIQRYSIHDGPGIRTNVFLKGCPLRCLWCCNPESQKQNPELAFLSSRCTSCGLCMKRCPQGAILPDHEGKPVRNTEKCVNCGMCVTACPQGAWKRYGNLMTVEEVFEEVLRDEVFFRKSGGGVTFSGGEPTVQAEFLRDLLECARYHGIHTALETSGYASEAYIDSIRPLVDLFMIDLKHMNSSEHKRLTGVGNELILSNARRLVESGSQVVFRIPLIPNYNVSPENMRQTGQFVKLLGAKRLILLPFHQLGASKYDYIKMNYELKDNQTIDDATVEDAKHILEEYVDKVTIGGDE